MELKTYFAQDASGNIMPGATVTVYEAGTATLATGLQDESGSPLANPFTADSSAKVAFYAPDGLYDITVVGNGRTVTILAQFVSVDGASVLRSDLAAPGGSALVVFQQDGSGSVPTTLQEVASEVVYASRFMTPDQIADVRSGLASVDVTSAVNAALAYGRTRKMKVRLPAGALLITESLSLASGTQIEGEKMDTYPNGYGVDPKATTIVFNPATPKDLFVADGATVGGFRFHVSVSNLFINGSGGSTCRWALNLDSVIYGLFENLSVVGFQSSTRHIGTIANRFVNCTFSSNTVSTNQFDGFCTTDVFEQCTFSQSPSGPVFDGSNIGIRFDKPLFEQLDNIGIDVSRECQNIIVSDGYAEDVPYTANPSGGMFRVGARGATNSNTTQLQVIGGHYAGRNAGLTGSFLTTDFIDSVMLTSVFAARYTNAISPLGGTPARAIKIAGLEFVSVTNFCTDLNKIQGIYTPGPIGAGVGEHLSIQTAKVENLFVNGEAALAAGTWTPTFSALSGAFGAIAYSTQSGKYVRLGSMVIATFNVVVSSVTTGTAATLLLMDGLPFTVSQANGSTQYQSNWVSKGPDIVQWLGSGTTMLFRSKTATSSANVPPSEVQAGTEITGTVIYFV